MAWNQPGNNGQDRDPWGGDDGNSGRNKNDNQNPRPPKGDDLFQKINVFLGNLLKKAKGKNKGYHGSSNGGFDNLGYLIGIGLVIAVVIWGVSGFYTIQEGKVGVITRYGKLLKDQYAKPGLNWRPRFIDEVITVDSNIHRTLEVRGIMLTADENVVHAAISVEYDVDDPVNFLFSVTNAQDSLRQATDSALRAVISKYTMDRILTEGRHLIREDTRRELISIIEPYNMGIRIIQVNLQNAWPPEEVKAAFDDVIDAREDRQRFILESVAYQNKELPKAYADASRIIADSKAYRDRLVFEAKGEADRFVRLLAEYQQAKEVTRQRLYIETMEKILAKNNKVLMSTATQGNNLMVMPLEQLMKMSNNGSNAVAQSNLIANDTSGQNQSEMGKATNSTTEGKQESVPSTNNTTQTKKASSNSEDQARSSTVRRGR